MKRPNKHHRVTLRGVMGPRDYDFTLGERGLSVKEIGKSSDRKITLSWEHTIGYVLIFTEPVQKKPENVRFLDIVLRAPDPKLPDKSFRLSFGDEGVFIGITPEPGMSQVTDPWYMSWRSIVTLAIRSR